ncbi:hypothetical protein B7P43_G06756 [Cryptotermes secundus]|nr:hypothetical protein B7P43_G06756 [Cryptotermes secundus]
MFASQSQEGSEVSGELSETFTNYGDFVKGSVDGSHSLMQSSTTLSEDPSSKFETSLTKSERKRKHEESLLIGINRLSKLPRIVEEEGEGKDMNVEQARYSKEGSSLGVHSLPSSPAASASADDSAKHKSNLPLMSPTKVTLKEKEVEISPKANKKERSGLTSPKASRRLIFETETERPKPQFVLSSSRKIIGKVESQTHRYEEEVRQSVTDALSVQGNNDSSPEIEILNSKKPRQSIEVLFVSSHSHDSTKSTSQHEVHTGRNRASGGTVEVIDVDDNADRKKDIDTEAEGSDGELYLRLSPSPSQKPLDFVCRSDKNSSSHSVSVSGDHTSYSSYKSSNAESLSSGSRGEQEVLNTMKHGKKLLSGGSNSKRYSVYTIQEEDTEEELEKASQVQSNGSSTNSGYTNGSCDMAKKKLSKLHSLTTANSHEVSLHIDDSGTSFGRVKAGAQVALAEPSQFVGLGHSESQLTTSKRKRDHGKEGIPIVSIVGSDSESDGHSTPSEAQKKARTANGDVGNGRTDTPSILHQKPSTLLQKGILRLHSTPHMDHAVTAVKESSASSIEQDSLQGNEMEWEVVMKVKLKCVKENDKDVYKVQQCEDITEEYAHFTTRRLSDYSSSGGLADVSSKTTSPSSTISGPALFPLPPNRMSVISMVSSSSTSSGGSSVAQGVTRHKYATDGGPFIMPNHPGPKMSRDRSFRSEEGPSGNLPGIHSPVIEGMDIVEKVFISSHPESSERGQGGSARADTGDSGRKSDLQKPGDEPVCSQMKDLSVVRETDDAVSASPACNDAVPVPANVLKETPKTTVKPLKGRQRSTIKKCSLSRSFSKQDVESRRGRRTPARNKTPVTSSVEDVTTQIPKSGLKESSDTVTMTIPGTPEVLSTVLEASHLRPGAPVFARWTDKKYYSGRLKEKSKDGRWVVLFDDGKVKSLVEDFIIVVDRLSKGQLVYALVEDEDYMSGVIVTVQKKPTDIMYSVELDDGNFVAVPRSSLFMTEDQAKILRESVSIPVPTKSPHHKADVSLDNVLEGKRSRIGIREMKNKFDSPGISGESKTAARRKVSSPSLTESDTGSTMEDVDGVERESMSREIKLRKVKGQGRRTPRKNW